MGTDYHERAIKAWDTRGRSGQGSGSAGRASTGDFGDAGADVRMADGTLKDERGGAPPKAGEPFVVYRLGASGTNTLAGKNAGNAEGVANFIISDKGEGDTLHAFRVVSHEEFGPYQMIRRGGVIGGPGGESGRVGRIAKQFKDGSGADVAYSFPQGANFTATKIGEIGLDRAKEILKSRGKWTETVGEYAAKNDLGWGAGGTRGIAGGIREAFRK